MTIHFRDFASEVKSRGFFSNEYATLQETVDRANAWIAEVGVRVLNVETVVLPNVGDGEEKTAATAIRTSGEMSSWWYQVVRVWYQEGTEGAAVSAS
jgi:hypothetical protein